MVDYWYEIKYWRLYLSGLWSKRLFISPVIENRWNEKIMFLYVILKLEWIKELFCNRKTVLFWFFRIHDNEKKHNEEKVKESCDNRFSFKHWITLDVFWSRMLRFNKGPALSNYFITYKLRFLYSKYFTFLLSFLKILILSLQEHRKLKIFF